MLTSIQNSTSQIVDGVQTAGTYAFEIMVRGTIASGIADIICAIGWILFMYISYSKLWSWVKGQKDDEDVAFVALLVALVILFGSILLVATLNSAMVAIFAPDYVVLNKLIELATSQ